MKGKRAQKTTKQAQHNPGRATTTPNGDSPAIMAAREQEAKAAEKAQQARSIAEAGQREVEQAGQALAAKEREVAKVRTEFETVGERLAGMPLDDPDSERVGGRHRHLELVLARLEGERGGCHETLLTAQRRAEESHQAAEVASAGLRNAQRWVRLQELQERFPAPLDELFSLIQERNRVLNEADRESDAYQLARVGRARLLPRQDQLRRDEMYELASIVMRHQSGLSMVPSARFADFSMDSGNGGGEAPLDKLVEPDEIPDLSEEDWVALSGVQEGEFDG